MRPSNTAGLRNPEGVPWPNGGARENSRWRPYTATDDPERLHEIVAALDAIARSGCPVVWPIHPRTAKRLAEMEIAAAAVVLIEPVSYLDMLLEGRARFILTDSGGVQKEAYFLKVPCITLRDETEWVETLACNCNVLTGADSSRIQQAVADAPQAGP
jgi:UDP-GlcNAc3NAcA epimerase